jgi:uncharacterized protein YjiS (DUF1127 family)
LRIEIRTWFILAASLTFSGDRTMTATLRIAHGAGRASPRFGLASLLACWRQRRRQRADLRRLLAVSPHLVRDIGLTPSQAWLEAMKPFWRA